MNDQSIKVGDRVYDKPAELPQTRGEVIYIDELDVVYVLEDDDCDSDCFMTKRDAIDAGIPEQYISPNHRIVYSTADWWYLEDAAADNPSPTSAEKPLRSTKRGFEFL